MSVTDKAAARHAVRLHITGVVQGVGFRPFIYRVAQRHGIAGWVLNAHDGVHVVAEASDDAIARFVDEVRHRVPPAAHVATFDVTPVAMAGLVAFEIRESAGAGAPTVRISPDLAVCDDCLRELFDPSDRRFGYPYINCTNCGPRMACHMIGRVPRCATGRFASPAAANTPTQATGGFTHSRWPARRAAPRCVCLQATTSLPVRARSKGLPRCSRAAQSSP
jgi:acylphosphatase